MTGVDVDWCLVGSSSRCNIECSVQRHGCSQVALVVIDEVDRGGQEVPRGTSAATFHYLRKSSQCAVKCLATVTGGLVGHPGRLRAQLPLSLLLLVSLSLAR